MHITDLELTNFRKFQKIKLDNLSSINVIIGKNGVGKTSIIESIYFGSIAKSFKSYYDDVLLKNGESFFKLKISLDTGEKQKKLEIIVNGKDKKAKINGQILKKLSDYICEYSVILFSPDDTRLIKDNPNTRRNYLNIELSNVNKEYIGLINMYNKLIKNKNDYLKKINLNSNLDKGYLDVLDEKISEIGLKICEYRKKYIDDVNKYIDKIFKRFKKEDDILIKYNSDFLNKNKDEIINLLKKVRQKEMILGLTTTGIHRDDFEFLHNNRNAVDYSSQGIQKLILLSFKLSEIKVLDNEYKIKPILLLDDLFSELDESNQKKVMKLLFKKYQTFITTTDLNNIKLKDLKNVNVIKIREVK